MHDRLEGPFAEMADKRRHEDRASQKGEEEPPNSRLFVLCGRNMQEEELRDAFAQFGEIKELWIVKEKDSGQSRGIAYIKYSKTYEAAVAMETMNGKFIGNNHKALKVMIASGREQGSKRETNETERLLRLFIIVPRQTSEEEIRKHFAQFGDIEHCNIVKDRNTKESKGFGYVKYFRISHAAKAFENCDRSYKPKFADPRPTKQDQDRYSSSTAHGSTTGQYDLAEYPLEHHHYQHHPHHPHASPLLNHHPQVHPIMPEPPARLSILAHKSLNQDQLWRLCDFFPGLDYCNVRHDGKQSIATVVYNSSQAAAHAKDKLHGFEYPPGHRLIVRFDEAHGRGGLLGAPQSQASPTRYPQHIPNGSSAQAALAGQPLIARAGSAMTPDLAVLAETIAQATSMFNQAAGFPQGAASASGESYDPSYCSVKLPAPQPLAPIDSTVAERLFVVCQPRPPPLYALKDVFGRFGHLIDVFMLNMKNHGYAKYASKASADEARLVLHGQEVLGMRLKVLQAEPQEPKGHPTSSSPSAGSVGSTDQKCKRPKLDLDDH